MGRLNKTQQQYDDLKRLAWIDSHTVGTFLHKPCGKTFTKYAGSEDSYLDHVCDGICEQDLLYPFAALARRVSRELPLWRAGSVIDSENHG